MKKHNSENNNNLLNTALLRPAGFSDGSFCIEAPTGETDFMYYDSTNDSIDMGFALVALSLLKPV